jgi:acyl-coenzyme A thioesterase PaaI-like protein
VEPTISLSIEYLAPVKAGDWVEGEATLLRATTRMLFSSMIGRVEGQAVFHTSAIFRLRHRVDENSMARLASLVSSDRSST